MSTVFSKIQTFYSAFSSCLLCSLGTLVTSTFLIQFGQFGFMFSYHPEQFQVFVEWVEKLIHTVQTILSPQFSFNTYLYFT